MRDTISAALETAKAADDRVRLATLRLLSAAVRDRDEANGQAGQARLSDEAIRALVGDMVRQRKDAAFRFVAEGHDGEAEREIREIHVLKDLLPPTVGAGELEQACRAAVAETNARGLRDVGRCLAALKARYQGSLDMGEASGMVRQLLR